MNIGFTDYSLTLCEERSFFSLMHPLNPLAADILAADVFTEGGSFLWALLSRTESSSSVFVRKRLRLGLIYDAARNHSSRIFLFKGKMLLSKFIPLFSHAFP